MTFNFIEKGGKTVKKLARINEGKEGSVGLNNTRERVRYIYGEAAKLIAEHGEKEGTRITIVLPQ